MKFNDNWVKDNQQTPDYSILKRLYMKQFFSGLLMLITNFVMWIPFHFIRVSYLRLLLDRLGSNTELCRNIDIRSPQK